MGVKIKAFLLDLDDTLLINDMEAFSKHYNQALLDKIKGVCPPGAFVEALSYGVKAMFYNDGRQGTNEEVFNREFYQRLNRAPDEINPILMDFYRNEFEALAVHTRPDPLARDLVRLLQERGYKIAIATQPVFPLVAIEARLRWAGVGPEEFHYDFISSYEQMRACKPHPAFFEGILEHLRVKAPEAMMVGDSLEADMSAGRMGLRTFWVRRDPADRDDDLPVDCDAQGTLEDLINLIESGAIDEL